VSYTPPKTVTVTRWNQTSTYAACSGCAPGIPVRWSHAAQHKAWHAVNGTDPTPIPSPVPPPVPVPTPTPTPVPAPSGSGLPAGRFPGGYLTTWENKTNIRALADGGVVKLIYVAFAIGRAGAGGTLFLDMPPGCSTPADVKREIAYANSKGVKVIVSVGGYYDFGYPNHGYVIDTQAKQDEFMVSMRDYVASWGFNGMDWDLEQGNRPDIARIIALTKQMRAEFGDGFIIAAAPGANLQSWYDWGTQVDVWAKANGRNSFDLYGEQIYDQGITEAAYQALIAQQMTKVAGMFGWQRTALGTKYCNDDGDLNDPQNNFVDIATTQAALATLNARGLLPRSVYLWTLQSDAVNGMRGSAAMKTALG
jgi:hypothetical protein